MRDIKFRAVVDSELIYQSNTHSFNVGGPHGDECLMWLGFDLLASKKIENVMQFTGLKDKNGVDIYEGDIVVEGGITAEIIFDQSRAFFCYTTLTGRAGLYAFYGEVIGNIHQNPELLENNDEKI